MRGCLKTKFLHFSGALDCILCGLPYVYYPVIILLIIHKNCSIEINISKQCCTYANAHLIDSREREILFGIRTYQYAETVPQIKEYLAGKSWQITYHLPGQSQQTIHYILLGQCNPKSWYISCSLVGHKSLKMIFVCRL